jgi:hypothetical protein
MTTKYHIRPISWVVAPEGARIFDPRTTTITIVDEAAGEFITITQVNERSGQVIAVNDRDEWGRICYAVDLALSEIECNAKNEEPEA